MDIHQKPSLYMNVNVHIEQTFWNLGITWLQESMSAEKCLEILERKLQEFGINFKNIVVIKTDGAALMKKVGVVLNIKVLYSKDNALIELEDASTCSKEDEDDYDEDLNENLNIVVTDDSRIQCDISHAEL